MNINWDIFGISKLDLNDKGPTGGQHSYNNTVNFQYNNI